MNKEQLFKSMTGIGDELLERSEKRPQAPWAKWAAAAACIGLLAGIWLWRPQRDHRLAIPETATPQPTDTTPETTLAPNHIYHQDYPITYNEAGLQPDMARHYSPGTFHEDLSPSELEAVIPKIARESMTTAGTAMFDGQGRLIQVFLHLKNSAGQEFSLTLGRALLRCCLLPEGPVVSHCGGATVTGYRYDAGDHVILEIEFTRGDTQCLLSAQAPPEEEAALEAGLEALLSIYLEGTEPDLSAVRAEEIPEWMDEALTFQEALAEADFGAYFPRSIPDGFTAESIRRCLGQSHNYLSGLWTRGYDSLSWTVTYLEEAQQTRVTTAEETENYDVSLYPIPRADSVPEELREIVDNPIFPIAELTPEVVWARAYQVDDAGDTGGWRVRFSVLYGNVVVEISATSISPDWLFDQLTTIAP